MQTHSTNSLIGGDKVEGTKVYNSDGDHLGEIHEIMIDKVSGNVAYAVMSFGGFLGIGEKFHPVPWPLLDYDVEQDGFVVPLDPAALKNAPSYDAAEVRELGGPAYRTYGDTIYGYYGTYGAVPYW